MNDFDELPPLRSEEDEVDAMRRDLQGRNTELVLANRELTRVRDEYRAAWRMRDADALALQASAEKAGRERDEARLALARLLAILGCGCCAEADLDYAVREARLLLGGTT